MMYCIFVSLAIVCSWSFVGVITWFLFELVWKVLKEGDEK